MKERPILFSAPMVRAILAGTKTQTRRAVKPQPEVSEQGNLCGAWLSRPLGGLLLPKVGDIAMHCPYGKPGDRLWVREAFRFLNSFDADSPAAIGVKCISAGYPKPWAPIQYKADGNRDNWLAVCTPPADMPTPGKLRPGIHMPRWASRILLEVTAVRVERLHDISQADCIAEGATGGHGSIAGYPYAATPDEHYRRIWEQINGAGAWDVNPWVWVIEFRSVQS